MTVLSCVKEARTDCPCYLDLLLRAPGTPALDARITSLARSDGNLVFDHDTRPEDGVEFVTIPVPKGTVRLAAVKGNSYMHSSDGILTIPEGEPSSQVYAWCDSKECRDEDAADTVRFAKQFALLTVKMIGVEPFGDISLKVRGEWSGMNLFTLEPMKGSFRADAVRMDDGRFSVALPRQGDQTLMMDMYAFGNTSTPEITFPIGKLIVEKGFDWAARSLGDIDMEIDYSDTEFSVSIVSDWVEQNQGEMEL